MFTQDLTLLFLSPLLLCLPKIWHYCYRPLFCLAYPRYGTIIFAPSLTFHTEDTALLLSSRLFTCVPKMWQYVSTLLPRTYMYIPDLALYCILICPVNFCSVIVRDDRNFVSFTDMFPCFSPLLLMSQCFRFERLLFLVCFVTYTAVLSYLGLSCHLQTV
jgi:hypothetical protein